MTAKPKASPRNTFTDALKDAIERSGLTSGALGREAGVPPAVISRFMAGARPSLTTRTLDKLAPVLGLQLLATGVKARPRKPAPARRGTGPKPAPAEGA